MNSNEPDTALTITSLSQATPWIQFGMHDHLFTWLDNQGNFQYYPMMNYTTFNPDGDVHWNFAVYTPNATIQGVD
jgi:hypothetical protein